MESKASQARGAQSVQLGHVVLLDFQAHLEQTAMMVAMGEMETLVQLDPLVLQDLREQLVPKEARA